MKTASLLVLLLAGAHAAAAQDGAAERIRKRFQKELDRTRLELREFVLRELADAGLSERSLSARVDRFAKALAPDELHDRLRSLLLSKDGKDLVEAFMAEQQMEDFEGLVDAYFEVDAKGRYRVREELEEMLAQLLDGVEPPPPGLLGIQLGEGLVVIKVTPGGAAETAGLKSGDVVVSIAGRNLASANVEEVMKSLKAGAEVTIVYERDKVRKSVTVKPK